MHLQIQFGSPLLSYVILLQNHKNCNQNNQMSCFKKTCSLLEILSFATSHYATGMQLIVVCNYLGHVCNYKFGIV
jgi:hypothetical protein